MFNIKDIHLIERNNKDLLFHYPSYTLLKITKGIYNIIDSVQKGNTIKEITDTYGYSTSSVDDLFSRLDSSFQEVDFQKKENNSIKDISRITLHISNDCNLRCKYCYANGGSYSMKRELMTTKTADKFIEFCAENFNSVRNIVFFGGEPLLNVNIIEYICKKFCKFEEERKIRYLPQFGIITNGTIINKHILEIIRTYISFITVSIDGPKSINDYNRVFINGNGSFDKIANFIDTVKEETSVDIKYEATYTSQHHKSNMSYGDLHEFFNKRFGIDGTIADELNYNSIIKNDDSNIFYTEDICNNNFKILPDEVLNIIYHVASKKPKQMCQLYRDIFAVSSLGEIYPCHMDIGNEKVKIGNIFGDNIYNNEKYFINKIPLLSRVDNKTSLCGNCWAKNVCAGCSRLWFYDKQLKTYLWNPNKELCDSNMKFIENVLMFISNIRENAEMWNLFLDRINCK